LKEKLSTPTLRSGQGRQPLAQHKSNPSYGFGSSLREDVRYIYASQEADRAKVQSMGGNQSPGAIYQIRGACGKQLEKTTMPIYGFGTEPRRTMSANNKNPGPGTYKKIDGTGKQVLSTKPTYARTHFGSSTRDIQEKIYIAPEFDKGYMGVDSPGPMAYKQVGSMGKMPISTKQSNPQWTQGTEKRFMNLKMEEAAKLPGAGQYKYVQACGKQVVSTKPSKARVSFGSSTRDHRARVYMNREAEASTGGKDSPGPMTAKPINAYGTQVLGTKKSNPSYSWGTSNRFGYIAKSCGPGPGEYYA